MPLPGEVCALPRPLRVEQGVDSSSGDSKSFDSKSFDSPSGDSKSFDSSSLNNHNFDITGLSTEVPTATVSTTFWTARTDWKGFGITEEGDWGAWRGFGFSSVKPDLESASCGP